MKFSGCAAVFFSFMLGYSVKTDFAPALGEYAFCAWLYFVVGHALAVAFFLTLMLKESGRKHAP
jgi:hypothetical protein